MNLLSDLLSTKNTTKTDLEKVIWFTEIFRWIQRPRSSEEKQIKAETIYTTRLRFILKSLEKSEDLPKLVAGNIQTVAVRLFNPFQLAQTGLPLSTSFQQDLWNRLEEKILPQKPLSNNLASMLLEAFPDESESLLIDHIDPQILHQLISALPFPEDFKKEISLNVVTACHMLSLDLLYQANLLTNTINTKKKDFTELIEFKLETQLRQWIEDVKAGKNHSERIESLHPLLVECDLQTDHLFEKMQQSGVRIELVYGFHNYRRRIRRLKTLIGFFSNGDMKYINLRLYLSQTVVDVHHQNSLLSFLSENLTLLTRRIVQSNSHVGEHYVTYSWSEFLKMFYSSAGGGLVTAFTVFVKNILGYFGLTGFMKGLLEGLNYSGSFLLIQTLGFTLATKQPSSTALYLAQALEKSVTESRKTIVALLRTQFIAVLGNVLAVTPVCFLVGWSFYFFGRPIYTDQHAIEIVRSSQILGFAPLYATITGFFLFFSSLIAGWFENFSLQKQIATRLKENARLRKWIGPKGTLKVAEFFENNSNAFAGNFALGLILGLAPQFIKFLGVPIEVRHVTLASGSFATAIWQAVQSGINHKEIIDAVAGLVAIGFINISVSFSLAFLLASVSTQVSLRSLFRILKWGLQLIITKPWLLLIPEKESKTEVQIPKN